MSSDSKHVKNHNVSIPELNDADFISFLYAERDRENNISQFQGWNNWALIGALITVICLIYSLFRDNNSLCIKTILHSASGVISLYLYLKAALVFVKRERGYSYSRVRVIKDEIPWEDVGLVCVFSIIFITISFSISEYGLIFWAWVIVLCLYIIAIVISLCHRDTILPSKYDNVFLPNFIMYVAFVSFVGGCMSLIICHTIITIAPQILTTSFELGCCLAICLVIINLLIQINTSNKVVNRFDAIIDGYVYAGKSKELTYQAILSNRMGYSAIEVCQKELEFIHKSLSKYDEIEEEFNKAVLVIKEGSYDFEELQYYYKLTVNSIKLLKKTLKVSRTLTSRVSSMLEISIGGENIHELEKITKFNDKFQARILSLINKVEEVTDLVRGEVAKYYCNKYGGLCGRDCKHRNERLSYLYKIKLFFLSMGSREK